MSSKQKTPKASPSQKQSKLETFINQSDCITIPDSSQDIPSSPLCSNAMFVSPEASDPSPSQGKESTASSTTGTRAVDLAVSLDALAIVKQANSTG